MITSVGLQYARAIFDIALETNNIDKYSNYLQVANEVLNKDEIINSILHPSINIDEKKEIIANAFDEYFDKTFVNFLKVLIDNNRLHEIKDILDCYKSYLNDYINASEAIVYSKYPLNEVDLKKIEMMLSKKFNKTIILKVIIDEKIIGGIVINIDGKIIDGSVINQLNNIKNELMKGW